MRSQGVMRAFGVLTVTLLLVVLGAGCTKYATEEDLQNLERQKQAALSAEQKVVQLKAEVKDLEVIKADKEAELQEVVAEKAAVTERIGKLTAEEATEMGLEVPATEATEGSTGEVTE